MGLATWIKRCHSVLSKTISFSNSLISRSFLIVFLGLPLPLVICVPSIWSTLLTTAFTCLLSTCSNHLSLASTIFSTIGVTPTLSLSLMLSFLIQSRLVLPHSQHNILISSLLRSISFILVIYHPTSTIPMYVVTFSQIITDVYVSVSCWCIMIG